jgi:hypothetical protein
VQRAVLGDGYFGHQLKGSGERLRVVEKSP